ncbi:MAG: ATP-binding cassette domain-containing protein [Clostridia bacterium]|nr:ATP-binding cassette domain-containing protein [Clostridia bacterium]MBP5592645.1 ATP-binding cassette domain-containing protein [Clostridia bacterium]
MFKNTEGNGFIMERAIKINNLTKLYKDVIAVDNLNLEIYEGELFSLLGVNGAGKTTTIKMLATLTRPTNGDAAIFDYSILKDEDKIKEVIDISMQETAIARKLTVEENIVFYAKLSGQTDEEIIASKEKICKSFELDKVLKKQASKLSGGWQRKLSIALALISNPKILFLDEPTLGLDVLARRELWKTINELKGKMTIILTTHYMEEAEALSDRIGIMKDGKLLFVGTKEELFLKTNKENVEDAFIEIVSGGAL